MKRRLLGRIGLGIFCLTLLVTMTFVAMYGRHECSGLEDCEICPVMHSCRAFLLQSFSLLGGALLLRGALPAAAAVLGTHRRACPVTLVSRKVELRD